MKKIDKLLLNSFFGPFVVCFGIAIFVLIMQFLWLYIDEIAGKGVSVFIILELLGYMSISVFPMALPIAILISSVMVVGNLAERYELSSFKSAGVSLLRTIRSLVFVCAGLSLFSYVCSDFLIPYANLKFKSRLYDIRKQKPAMTLEKGVFNEDFRQFVIRIGDKEKDGETISDVMLEDQTNQGRLKFNQILADSGQMYTTTDKRYFVMNLFRGTQYQEPGIQSSIPNQSQKYPFIRTNFKTFTKVWDMGEFEMVRTDEGRFSKNRTSLSMDELRFNLDSLKTVIYKGQEAVAEDWTMVAKRVMTLPPPHPNPSPTVTITTVPPPSKPAKRPTRPIAKGLNAAQIIEANRAENRPSSLSANQPIISAPKQKLTKDIAQYTSFGETFEEKERASITKVARDRSATNKNQLESKRSHVEGKRKEWVKTGYELYVKYSFALVCFIFLFIGAPMGAIIRKGGFGYPILVAIIFFITFIMLTILCRKLAESYVLPTFWAAMTPAIILIPIGVYLTRKAMNDSPLFNTDWLGKVKHWYDQRKVNQKEVPSI